MYEDLLQSALRAIEIEHAHAVESALVRVREVWSVDERVSAATVEADVPLEPSAWRGGVLARRLTDGAEDPVFRAEILEIDPDSDTLYLRTDPGTDPPTPGPARVFPYDFLRAPWRLLTEPAFDGLRGRLGLELAAALGEVEASALPGPAGLHAAWGHDRALVWGPPGTGKTTTIVREVATLLQDPRERLLLVSTTNRATDELALRLGALLRGPSPGDGGAGPRGERGVDRLQGLRRLGSVVRAREYVDAGLGGILPDPALLPALTELQDRLERARSTAARASLQQQLQDLRAGLPTLATCPRGEHDRCVVTTLHAALSAVVADGVMEPGPPFTTVVVDEAGLVGRLQAAAVSLLASARVVLVGDPRQLSPIARADRSVPREVHRWVARSALDHLDDEESPAVQRLVVQHRMHPDIRAAVSALAYGGQLVDAPGLADRAWGDSHLRRLPRAVWYVLDEHTERRADLHSERGPGGVSRQRRLGLAVIEELCRVHPSLREKLLVITPYRAQVQLLREARGAWRASTVHAQQGSEADVVVFDTVHASSTAWPPAEWVRLVNVGLSRARHLVIVLASRAEMEQPFLRPLRSLLAPMVLRRGRWEAAERSEGVSLFVAPLAAEPEGSWEVEDSDRLGAQLAARKRLRPVMSQEQARLVHRELSDSGPRLVRGVAGSGKTLVLAHWVVRALQGLGVPYVVVVYANKALGPLLGSVVEQAWSSQHPAPGPMPWDRVKCLYIGDLVADLLAERGLPHDGPGEDKWDFASRARRLLEAGAADGRFPAVFVDEAQDVGHDALRLLIGLTEADERGSRPIMLFYDNAQNVYGRATPVWRDLGLDLRGRSDVMRESFRSTRPNHELALDVLHQLRPIDRDPDLRELMTQEPPLLHRDEEGWHAEFCAVGGQAPAVRLFHDREAELRLVVEQVQRWIVRDGVSPGDIRVLALKNVRDLLVERLRRALAPVRVLERRAVGYDDARDAVVVTTPHSFKGYDAELVVVAGADGYHSSGKILHAPLYVALTRARTLLLVTGTRPGAGPGQEIIAALDAAGRRWSSGLARSADPGVQSPDPGVP